MLEFLHAYICGQAGHFLFILAVKALQLFMDVVGTFFDFRGELSQVIFGFGLWNGFGQNDTVELFGLFQM